MSVGVRAAVGVLLIAAAIGLLLLLRATRTAPERAGAEAGMLAVRAMEVRPVGVARSWLGHGAVRPLRAAQVSAEVGGRVVERPEGIEDGVAVEVGDLLVQIDPRDYEAQLAAAQRRVESLEAQLEALQVESVRLGDQLELAQEDVALQQRELERVQEAVAAGAGTQVDLDQAQTNLTRARRELAEIRQRLEVVEPRRAELNAMLEAARTEVDTAGVDLERTSIRSPITGFIQEVTVEAGERLAPGEPVARIVTLSRLEVPLQVPVSASAGVSPGDRVALRAEGPIPTVWEGEVSRVAPEASRQTRSLTAFVVYEQDVPEAGVGAAGRPLLLPGQYVTGRIYTAQREPQIVVPRRAVVEDEVFVLVPVEANGSATYRVRALPVVVEGHVSGDFDALDPLERQWAVVSEGLEPGMLVVVSNLDELREGLAVRLLEEDAGAEGP